MITRDDIETALPKNMRVSDSFINTINKTATDPLFAKELRDNFIGFSNIVKQIPFRVKATDYYNAVKFTTYLLSGCSSKDAYIKTFPDRYNKLVKAKKDVSNYVNMYKNNKLVTAIIEQSLIPLHIVYRDVTNEAINSLVQLMRCSNSDRIKMESANSLLNHLKKPESKSVEIDLNIKEDSGLTELKDTLTELAKTQRELLSSGSISTKDIANINIIDITPNNTNVTAR